MRRADSAGFAVLCIKDDGRRALFGRYATRQAAEEIAQRLRAVNCPCEVVAATRGLPTRPGAAVAPADQRRAP